MVRPVAVELPGPRPKGYAHACRAAGLVFVSGQIGAELQADGSLAVVRGGLVPQFERALGNVTRIIEASGGTPDRIIEMTIYVKDMAGYRASRKDLGMAWQRVLGRHYPAMTLVAVTDLVEPDALVEISAVAAVE